LRILRHLKLSREVMLGNPSSSCYPARVFEHRHKGGVEWLADTGSVLHQGSGL
jgi:hypothetical protein